jgi:GcrA cell cycle regulator
MTSLPNPDRGWSIDRVTSLCRLWREGLSASQIAKQMGGVTRNAVIGKVHRLGLTGRGAPSLPRTGTPRDTRPRRAPKATNTASHRICASRRTPSPAASEGPGLVDDLVNLKPHACKWPIGDPKRPEFSFCGRSTDGVYCAAHAALAFRPGSAWRVERDPVVKRALAGLA